MKDKIFPFGLPLGWREMTSVIYPRATHVSLKRFAQEFSKYMGGGYSFPVYQGRTAIYVALKALGLRRGDEILLPSFICFVVVDAVLDAGIKPVFTDVEEEYWTMDVESLKEHISPKTKAVLPVHTYGQACEMKDIIEISEDHNLFVVEDCAQALGGQYHHRPLGSIGNAAIFSCNVDKPMTTGMGGVVYTKNKKLASRILRIIMEFGPCSFGEKIYCGRKMASAIFYSRPPLFSIILKILSLKKKKGIEKKNPTQISRRKRDHFVVLKPMTREGALFGTPQIKNIDSWIEQSNENAHCLTKRLKHIDFLELPKIRKNCRHTFLSYTVNVKGENPRDIRNRLMASLHQKGIHAENRVWPVAIHQIPEYQDKLKLDKKEAFPVTDDLVNSFLNLPVHPVLNKKDINHIVKTITEFTP